MFEVGFFPFYSMEGTILKLPEVVELKKKYKVSERVAYR